MASSELSLYNKQQRNRPIHHFNMPPRRRPAQANEVAVAEQPRSIVHFHVDKDAFHVDKDAFDVDRDATFRVECSFTAGATIIASLFFLLLITVVILAAV